MRYSLLLLTILLFQACKNDKVAQANKKNPVDTTKIDTLKELSFSKPTSDLIPVKLPPFMPKTAIGLTAIPDNTGKHYNGIFRLPSLIEWQAFMATMSYAPDKELFNSLVYDCNEPWWNKREVMKNVKSRNLLAYKRSWKDGNWYFAFNPRNYEVYFWK